MLDPSQFDYHLPKDLIANEPMPDRSSSRLLVVNRQTGKLIDSVFSSLIDFLEPSDFLVFNQSKVFPARVFAKKETGGKVELLFLHSVGKNKWVVISKPRLKEKQILDIGYQILDSRIIGKVINSDKNTGEALIEFTDLPEDLFRILEKIGQTPIPPYINSSLVESELRQKYQTVYAKEYGSAAAPTAGLHFTKELLAKIKAKGIETEFVELHVGLGTFQPVREEQLKSKTLHKEYYSVEVETWQKIKKAKKEGRRIIAVGTTVTRVLETLAQEENPELEGSTEIFIYPPFQFKIVDALITNFHLPQSSLLMLLAAFLTDRALLDKIYAYAIKEKYRFFSFGDACFIMDR